MEKDYNLQKPVYEENVKQKESILSYLASKNSQPLQELQAEINSCQKEVEALKSEVEILEQTQDQPDQFMDFAQNQSKKAAKNLSDMISLEFAEVESQGKIITEMHKQKIVELDAKMQKGIQYAYKIMNDMLEKTNQPDKPVVNPVINPVINPVANPIKESIIKETAYKEAQPAQESINLQTQAVKSVQDPGNVQIIEGFWEEPKTEEPPSIKAAIPEQDSVSVLKNMYVVGKVAGEDLFDKSGKLIIAKNEIITEEVINRAEREGSLIELVLEMKLQEG